MNHAVVPHDEWLAARTAFLAREKELTRLRDELARARRELPWEAVTKDYAFDGPDGRKTLSTLFDGRSQLAVYHFMFNPKWDAGCPHCSHWADSFNGGVAHLAERDVTLVAISRAPIEKLEAYRKRMGWTFRWLSSGGSDFNYDYFASFSADEVANKQGFFNYARQNPGGEDREGMSIFTKDGSGALFHTYSTYARGLEGFCTMDYQILDLAPKGRDEGGRGPFWVRRHDEY